MKKIISFLICFAMLLTMSLAAFAEEEVAEEPEFVRDVLICTPKQFIRFANNCIIDSYSQKLNVRLMNDIDLAGYDFKSIPIFCGSFDGGGHAITGLSLTAEGSVVGLFRYVAEGATVKDLSVSGDIHPEGSHSKVGGIAGSNAGSISGCSFHGSLSGSQWIGGIAGINLVSGIIDSCSADGQLSGDHYVGGIVGENNGVIRDCVSTAHVNTTARQNTVSLEDITMNAITGSEAANTITDIGGIVGRTNGVLRGCKNYGEIGYRHMGYNIGGIAGTQSGYIYDCKNYASVQGRKEVGGIIGQMEPVSIIEYSQDTLQILDEQLGTMSGLVNQASYNAQSNANQITGQLGVLQDQAQTARDAVDTLFSPEQPDADTILAAQNALSSSLSAMPDTINGISAAAQNTVSGLSNDLQAISGQLNSMRETIDSASENIGGSIKDVSDDDTDSNYVGKVDSCANYGSVLADINTGGIAGAISEENDNSIFEDWQQSGDSSLNFQNEVRAVILNCDNHGIVTGKKQFTGGIVGFQPMGLVKNCTNSGMLDAQHAEYVGGISGISQGFIRSCNSKSEISGHSYVGGIAGSAVTVSDCLSTSIIHDSAEKTGAILGIMEESRREEENPVCENFYLSVNEDIGAIDGISYEGIAQALNLSEFQALENLPSVFEYVVIHFRFEDGMEKLAYIKPGSKLDVSEIPEIPEKAGHSSAWVGYDLNELENVMHDISLTVEYTENRSVIQSTVLRDNMPIALAEGEFENDAILYVSEIDADIPHDEDEDIVECWNIEVSAANRLDYIRFRLPENLEHLKLYVKDENNNWHAAEHRIDGSYIVFEPDSHECSFALISTPIIDWRYIAIASVVTFFIMLYYINRIRNKNKCG